MENFKKYSVWVVVVVLLLLLFASECRRRNEKNLSNDNLASAMDSTRHYKNRLNGETATVKTLQLDKKQMRDLIVKKDSRINALSKDFANVKTVTQWHGGLRIDSIPVPFSVPAPCVFTRTDSVATKHYSFGYTINQDGLLLENLEIPDTVTVITGTKRKWFFGKQTLTTDVTHSNKYVKVTGITAAEIVIPEPWYKKWYLWLVTGIVTGALIK